MALPQDAQFRQLSTQSRHVLFTRCRPAGCVGLEVKARAAADNEHDYEFRE